MMGASVGKPVVTKNGSIDSSRSNSNSHATEFSKHLNTNTDQEHFSDHSDRNNLPMISRFTPPVSVAKDLMVVLYDFTESMKSQITIKRGELVRLLGYSPAGDWSEVEAGDIVSSAGSKTQENTGTSGYPQTILNATNVIHTAVSSGCDAGISTTETGSSGSRYRRGWVPTSYLAPANMFAEPPFASFTPPLPPPAMGTPVESSAVFNAAQSTDPLHPGQFPFRISQMPASSGSAPLHIVDSTPANIHGPSLSAYPWYHGAVSRQSGEQLLRVGITGSFLVRASESAPGQLSVTVRHLGRVYHYRINQDPRGLFYITNVHRFPTVVQLIDHHSRSADGLVCPLLYPVPRQQYPIPQTPYSSVATAQAISSAAPPAPSIHSHQATGTELSTAQHDSLFTANPTHPGIPLDLVWSATTPVTAVPPATADGQSSPFALDGWEVERAEIVMCHKLGCGQYADVYEAIWKRHNTVVAVKTLKQDVNLNVNDFLKEASIMKKLRHRNLVQLLGVCTREPPLYLITEYMPYGNLLNYLRGRSPGDLTPPILLYMAVQIASGMSYLEANSFIHRDLAARNCLVGERNLIKVADFGLARYMQRQDKTYTARNGAKFPIKWTAPEGLAYYLFSSKSDVWAFGVVLWELATYGLSPYPGVELHDVYHLLEKGYRMERPHGCPEVIYAIMLRCWEWEANARPSFREIHAELERMCYTMNIEAEVARELEKRQPTTFPQVNPRPFATDGPAAMNGFRGFSPIWNVPPSVHDPRQIMPLPNAAHPTFGDAHWANRAQPHGPTAAQPVNPFYSEEDRRLSAVEDDGAEGSDEDEPEDDAFPRHPVGEPGLPSDTANRPATSLRNTVVEPRRDFVDSRLASANHRLSADFTQLQEPLRAMSLAPKPSVCTHSSNLASNPAAPPPPHRMRIPAEPITSVEQSLTTSVGPSSGTPFGDVEWNRDGIEKPKFNGRSRPHRHGPQSEKCAQNGTTRSRDTDTPDESGVGESIISNDSPADSGGGGGVVVRSALVTSLPQQQPQQPVPTNQSKSSGSQTNVRHVPITRPNQYVTGPVPFDTQEQQCLPSNGTSASQQQQVLQIANVFSRPVLRLSADSVDQFSTIPPHDRIGRFLESLSEMDTSRITKGTTTTTTTMSEGSSLHDSNSAENPTEFLAFLKYPPPPPPQSASPNGGRTPSTDFPVLYPGGCLQPVALVPVQGNSTQCCALRSAAPPRDCEPDSEKRNKARQESSRAESTTCSEPDLKLHTREPEALADPGETSDSVVPKRPSSFSHPPDTIACYSDSNEDLDDVYQAPDTCYSIIQNGSRSSIDCVLGVLNSVSGNCSNLRDAIVEANSFSDTFYDGLRQLSVSLGPLLCELKLLLRRLGNNSTVLDVCHRLDKLADNLSAELSHTRSPAPSESLTYSNLLSSLLSALQSLSRQLVDLKNHTEVHQTNSSANSPLTELTSSLCNPASSGDVQCTN